jgi:hypothetical protein
MGYGGYSYEAHMALTRERSDAPIQEVFKQRSCHPLMDPKGVRVRESRDSAEHPQSLGIVFALDVTGSMGHIPDLLARQELPSLMKILTSAGVRDPQVLFMAVGDARADKAPLQVGQFETTAELMDQWLTFSFLEGGGGDIPESYELALYFLAEHTDMDCWVKRKKRGYLFMTGDAPPFPAVSKHQVDGIIGDRLDDDIPTEHVVAAVAETFHPFFFLPGANHREGERRWRDLMGDHLICLEDPHDTCYAAASLVALTEGLAKSVDDVARFVETAGADRGRVAAVVRAITPYASLVGRDGAPEPALGPAVVSSGASGWRRLDEA